MGDRVGDKTKQPTDCTNNTSCPHIKETGGGFEGEQYDCEICGLRIYLDYEEMK